MQWITIEVLRGVDFGVRKCVKTAELIPLYCAFPPLRLDRFTQFLTQNSILLSTVETGYTVENVLSRRILGRIHSCFVTECTLYPATLGEALNGEWGHKTVFER